MMRTIFPIFVALALLLFGQEAFGQSRGIVPGDVGIQVPFGAAGNVLVAGPTTSQLQDPSTVATTSTDVATAKMSRTANYSGGTSGFVNGTLRVNDTVSAGITAYEWTATFIMTNNSTSTDNAQNVAAYAQGKKQSSGATWAFVSELQDSSTDPVAGSISTEMDLFANGTDANGNRVILDVTGGKRSGGSGVTPTITRALRIGASFNTTANATFVRGLAFSAATYTSLIGTENTPTTTNGIDLSGATISGNAFMSSGFSVDSTGAITALRFVPTSTSVVGNSFFLSAANTPAISASGTIIAKFAALNGAEVIIGNANTNANDMLSVGQVANAERSISLINQSTGTAAQASIYIGNNTSINGASLKLNGGGFSGGLGANAFAINGVGGVWVQGNNTTGLIITSGGVPQLPSVATGTPVASLCLDASNNVIKKTTTGPCI